MPAIPVLHGEVVIDAGRTARRRFAVGLIMGLPKLGEDLLDTWVLLFFTIPAIIYGVSRASTGPRMAIEQRDGEQQRPGEFASY